MRRKAGVFQIGMLYYPDAARLTDVIAAHDCNGNDIGYDAVYVVMLGGERS
jgi:hypothetical protein